MGVTTAPFTFLGSVIRRERLFHPDGEIYRADVEPIAQSGPLGRFAQRLSGTALVRLSGGLRDWPQGKHARDVLGMAVRFRNGDDVTPKSLPGDRDLLMVTARTLPGLVPAVFRTHVEDYLDNQYYAILPFTLEDVGKVYLRLVPTRSSPAGEDRRERLARAVAEGSAVLRLELQRAEAGEQWIPLVSVDLRERLDITDAELRFAPSAATAGLVPRGVVQWIRPLAYAASQVGRQLTTRRRAPAARAWPRASEHATDPPRP